MNNIDRTFDLLVIGGGAAGLVSSAFAAGLGLKVGLVSDGPPGGECLWTGCVPSKALIHFAGIAHVLRSRGIIDLNKANVSFKDAMAYMREARQRVSHHDSVEAVEKNGVRVIEGRARFIASHTIEVNGRTLKAKKFIIATGGRQDIPPVTGLAEAGCLTHETILNLEEKPEHLVIIGAGPVGVEYAQVMLRLGVEVTIVEMTKCPLPKEEPETSEFVCSLLKKEGVTNLQLQNKLMAVEMSGKYKVLTISGPSGPAKLHCDQILVATGKTPNTEDLNLQIAGVETTQRGFIKINQHQRTTSSHIWACGDVCEGYQFTHFADHQARVAVLNACLGLPSRREERVVPWCTFTDPEIASVGMREEEAIKQFGPDKIFALRYNLDDFDRAILDDAAEGFMKAVIDRKGTILGVSIVGQRAGELIHEFALAMKANLKITDLSGLIHVYPTMSGAIRNLSNLYYQTVMKDSWQSKALKWWAKTLK